MKNYFRTNVVVYYEADTHSQNHWLDLSSYDTYEDVVSKLKSVNFTMKEIEGAYIHKFESKAPVLDKDNSKKMTIKEAFENVLAFDTLMDEYFYGNEENEKSYEHFANLFYAIEEVYGYDKLIDIVKNGDIEAYDFHPNQTLEDIARSEIEEISCYLPDDYEMTIFNQVYRCVDINKYIEDELKGRYVQTKYGVIRNNA